MISFFFHLEVELDKMAITVVKSALQLQIKDILTLNKGDFV